jgi:hypothetical protein
MRDRGNGLKAQPAVYRWTNGAGWAIPTSCEVMGMKAVNRKPVIRPEGTLALQGGEEVSSLEPRLAGALRKQGKKSHRTGAFQGPRHPADGRSPQPRPNPPLFTL